MTNDAAKTDNTVKKNPTKILTGAARHSSNNIHVI